MLCLAGAQHYIQFAFYVRIAHLKTENSKRKNEKKKMVKRVRSILNEKKCVCTYIVHHNTFRRRTNARPKENLKREKKQEEKEAKKINNKYSLEHMLLI